VEDFEVVATVPVVLGADVESAADSVRPFIALYAGGMGAKGANYHRAVLDRLGYTEACDEIQAHYLAGDRARATAAVPLELVRDIALVGTAQDIRAQLPAWEATAVTTMLIQADPRTLPAVADALRG
jgi:alkanesulfonate monooxygenase SsuD/methylene tetrahydromethanopterin reductase-like flavin-dependent oxidoreductase (luciferase family)